MSYRAPLDDIGFALKHGAALGPAIEQGLFGDLSLDDVEAVLAEAGRFAGEVIAPLNRIGDTFGAKFEDGAVTTAPGWKEAYRDWRLAGWNAVTAPAQWGGQALPQIVNAACTEMWHAASVGFANWPDADHGGDRRAQRPRQRHAQAHVSGKARLRRMDGHHAAHRAAGRLRRRRVAHARRARRRRQLSPQGPENLHHLRRARFHRQHHPFRAGAAARCAARHARHFAVPGAEIPAASRRLARRAQRRPRPFDRAQARHSRLADLHHDPRRQWRRHRIF